MSNNKITKNYLYNLTYQILAIIIPIITTPYLSRVLGAEKIGIYSFTVSITTYFILFGSLGIAMYGQREIAFLQNDIEKRSKVFFEIIILRFITLSISMLIFYFTFCLSGEYLIYYKILLLELFANMVDISWFFQGIEDFKKIVIRNLIVKIVSVLMIFLFVRNQNDLTNYFIIYAFSILFGNISLWICISKYIKKIDFKVINICQHIKPTISLFIPQIAVQVYTVLDKTMIGTIIVDKSEVGFYEQAQKTIKLLMTIVTSLGTVMMPRVAATFAEGSIKKVKPLIMNSFSFVLSLSLPLIFGIVSISNKFVPVFYGDGFDKVITLICVISPIILLIGMSNIIGMQYLLPTKQQKKFTFSVIAGAITNFILNLLLIKPYKSVGASIATVAAELIVTSIQFILIRKEISFKSVIKKTYNYLFASIIMFIISVIIGKFINNNIMSIMIQIIVSIIVYYTILVFFKDEIIINSFLKYKKKINNILLKKE